MINNEIFKGKVIPEGDYSNCTFDGCTLINYNPDKFTDCAFIGRNKNKIEKQKTE